MRKRGSSAKSELESLRTRLEEAEQTLEAIRSGKVDALIVSGPAGERVFTLQGADHRYRRIVGEGMTEGAVVVSPQGVVLYANSAFAALVAMPLDRVLGSQFGQYVPGAASSTFRRLLRDAETARVAVDTRLRAGADKIVPVHVLRGRRQRPGRSGHLPHRHQLERRDGEKRSSAFNSWPTCSRSSSGPRGPTARSTTAISDGSSLLRPNPIREGDGRASSTRKTCSFAWTPGPTPREDRATRTRSPAASGARRGRAAYRWHLGRALPQRAADQTLLRWYGSFTDIEDERALGAEAERARDKAQDATRLKDEFLATLSHELRTPLNGILGWGRLLQGGSLDDAKRERALNAIVKNAAAQNQLIDDLLDVSRIVAGKLRLNVAPVYVNSVIEAALDVVRPAADAKGVTLHAVLDPGAGLIHGDAGRLQQVIWNLLANAVKFTPKGGRVHVRLRRDESTAEISVADTGSGIAPDFLPYVFDRFRREDGAITRLRSRRASGSASRS